MSGRRESRRQILDIPQRENEKCLVMHMKNERKSEFSLGKKEIIVFEIR